ncbi:MAG: mechanosensitive ion channel family protein, partial [Oscillospiraceae bacterium]|nr:mechanosensitive ion channel family protein [Oscillospiraceae bacterium]
NDGEGTVAEISLTHVKLDTPDGQRIMLPTSTMVAGKIINYTTLGIRRANHAISVSYDCATEDVRASCLKAVSRVKGVLEDPAPAVVINNYGESAIEYRVRFWTKTEDYWDAHFQSLEEIRRCFAEDGIEMTYNHLNVHIIDNEKK